MQVQNNIRSAIDNITLVYSGTDYFEKLEQMILNAKFEIHIQTYIFNNDFIGNRIIEALKTAASANVKVFLLTDGFGSNSLPQKVVDELKKTGVNFRFFSPLLSANSFYIGR